MKMLCRLISICTLVTASICLVTCANVKGLDDNAHIVAVKADALSHAVVLGEPFIEKEDVYIPLIFGKYLFPIEVKVEIQTAQKIDNLFGLSESKSMVFESLEDINRVDLVALSGMVHSYIFHLKEVPSSEEANVEKFEIVSWTPQSALFTQTPYYDIINGFVDIFGVNNEFPLTLYPIVTVSDKATLPNPVQPLHFTFTSYDTQFQLPITAESGKERVWQIRLRQAHIIRLDQAPNTDSKMRLSLNAQTISATLSDNDSGAEVKAIEVDADNAILRLFIFSPNMDAQWEANLSFEVDPYTQIIDYKQKEQFLITGIGVQKSFYLVDVLEGCGVEWSVESARWLNPAAEVESLELLNYESEYGFMELGHPIIYPSLASVEIPVEKGFDFPLTIDSFTLQISKDALLTAPLPKKLIFTDFDTKYSVTVEAQNQNTKNWSIALFDARSGSGEARVTGYTLKSYLGTSQTSNNLILNPHASINVQNRTITLHILDWPQKFPLHIEGHVDISSGAQLFPFSFTADHKLIFNTLEETFDFTVVSENGDTELAWTIRLQNDATAIRSSAKEVVDFVSGAPSSGFLFAEKYLEPQKHQITLVVSERMPNTPMVLAPRITVSPNARLLDIVSGAQLSLSFEQPKLFYVQAEDESVEEWRIALVYAPQIPNSGFESWGKANNSDMNLLPANGTGWCTSNSSTMTNATRVAGYNSPYAVQVQTTLQTMNFVIFKVTTIAASTAFLGKFTLKTGVNDVYNPMTMTTMGIPFPGNAAPIAFSIDYKYVRGNQLMVTEPIKGSLIPSFRAPANTPGTDAASLRVELFYNPTGAFDYISAFHRNEAIARGEILERNDVRNWTHAYVPIDAAPGKEGLLPTHIVMVLTSSHEGDSFKGAPGSILTADNLTLIYYKPEEEAKLLP